MLLVLSSAVPALTTVEAANFSATPVHSAGYNPDAHKNLNSITREYSRQMDIIFLDKRSGVLTAQQAKTFYDNLNNMTTKESKYLKSNHTNELTPDQTSELMKDLQANAQQLPSPPPTPVPGANNQINNSSSAKKSVKNIPYPRLDAINMAGVKQFSKIIEARNAGRLTPQKAKQLLDNLQVIQKQELIHASKNPDHDLTVDQVEQFKQQLQTNAQSIP